MQNTTKNIFICNRFKLDLSTPKLMGIVNVNDDSFSGDGCGKYDFKNAIKHAESQLSAGADILDIGAESTRPNSDSITPSEEWKRLDPVLQELKLWNVPISVDTRNAETMQKAIEINAVDIINDIEALQNNNSLEVIKNSPYEIGICLMHMQNQPKNMQKNPEYQNDNVVLEVEKFLQSAEQRCLDAGIAKNRLLMDPGFCFGKTLQHNLALVNAIPQFCQKHQWNLLIGVSRKSMLGAITQNPVENRMIESVTAAILCADKGAKILRIHDVKATKNALQIWEAIALNKFSN